jgi:SPP1 family predicted phage head-tail adaptor
MTGQLTGPGDLNRRLVLQAPSETDDGAGGVIRSYTSVTTLWAKVAPQAMGGDVSTDSLGALLRYRIVIRRRDDVTVRYRFQEGGAIYRIVAARESADRRFLEIDAEVRED